MQSLYEVGVFTLLTFHDSAGTKQKEPWALLGVPQRQKIIHIWSQKEGKDIVKHSRK